jgi:flagellar basal-body rod protein FlgB
MDPTRHIAVFDLAEQRLAWIEQRQGLLARNVSNVTTPGYRAKDLTPFAQTLAHAGGVEPARTQKQHLAGTQGGALQPAAAARPRAKSLDGNAVSLEEQLTKIADTETSQALTTTIYKKYMGLFSLALGRAS